MDWDQRRYVAVPDTLDHGAPWTRFGAAMGGHQSGPVEAMWRMYEAQSLKDATMARSIGLALATASPTGRVLHVQGRFHSDYHAGVPAYLQRLMPDQALRVLTVLPVATAADAVIGKDADVADIVVYVKTEAAATD